MSLKGHNGVQEGERNVQAFLSWMQGVKDFKPYVYQGMLSISRVAREAGLNRDVFYTNPEIKDHHWPTLIKRLEEQGILKPRVANPVSHLPRQRSKDPALTARIKQIQEENEALKAENRDLRKQLEHYRKLQKSEEILQGTGRLPW